MQHISWSQVHPSMSPLKLQTYLVWSWCTTRAMLKKLPPKLVLSSLPWRLTFNIFHRYIRFSERFSKEMKAYCFFIVFDFSETFCFLWCFPSLKIDAFSPCLVARFQRFRALECKCSTHWNLGSVLSAVSVKTRHHQHLRCHLGTENFCFPKYSRTANREQVKGEATA